MILFRYFLIGLIVYLIVRAFLRYSDKDKGPEQRNGSGATEKNVTKRISKEVGEYVDYEEIKED
jgi:hypothetical protein